MTAQGHPGAIFWRAIQHGNLVGADLAAREIPVLPLDYALALVHLYGEKRDRRYERAALRYLERYIVEANPSLAEAAGVAALLAERNPG